MTSQETTAIREELIEVLRLSMKLIGYRSLGDTLTLIQSVDLSTAQLAALAIVRRDGPLTVTALSERLGLSLSNTSYLTDQLVKRGLLTRCEDPQDRRQKVIGLTAETNELFERMTQARVQGIAASMAAVPEALRRQLEDVLTQVAPYLETSF